MIATKITIQDRGLKRATRNLRPGSPPVLKMLKRWGAIYMARIRRRYNTLSRGGSDQGKWRPLAAATIEAKRSEVILKDKGELFNATGTSAAGADVKVKADRVSLGFAKRRHRGGISFHRLAEIHQTGDGVPKREIMVVPNRETVGKLIKEAERAARESITGR